jgi:hypothetical protein
MKPRNTLLLITSIATAVAGLGLVAPAMGQLTSNQLGTPDDGMVCRAGYNGALAGSAFKCQKSRIVALELNLKCVNPTFPNYVTRAKYSGGTSDGQDICIKSQGVQFDSDDPITSDYPVGGAWVYAAVDPTELNSGVANLHRDEARALGLEARDVDLTTTTTMRRDTGNNNRDTVMVSVWYYTFAIPTGPAISASR